MSNNLSTSKVDVSSIHFHAVAIMAKITFLTEVFYSMQQNSEGGLSHDGCEGFYYVLDELHDDMSDLMSFFETVENKEVR